MKQVTLCPDPEKHDCFPTGCEKCKPRAEFAFYWDLGGRKPFFTIRGGKCDGSTVCATTLEKLGIEVPEYPKEG